MANVPGSLRLNVFQTLVRQWESLHPHNAAQVLQIEGTADPETCEFAWQTTLMDLGLGRVSTDGVYYWHEVWDGRPAPPLVDMPLIDTGIEPYLTAAINRPFARNTDLPYRPLILQKDGHYFMGIVYQQWVADSVSIRLLLREWLLRVHQPQKAKHKLLPLAGGSQARGPAAGASPVRLLKGLTEAAVWLHRSRRLRRFPASDQPSDLSLAFKLHTLPDGLIDRLLTYTRAEGVTFNDLLLAVLAQICHRHFPAEHPEQRPDLALATSVDLRPYTPADLSETFGSLLAYTNITCPAEDMGDFRRLLFGIARQDRRIKDVRALAARMMLMRFCERIGRHRIGRELIDFYRRRIPIAGAVTNVNLNRSWAVGFHPSPIMSYFRVSSPGPTVPFVLAASTLGSRLNIAMTWRPSMLKDDDAAQIAMEFTETLKSLARR